MDVEDWDMSTRVLFGIDLSSDITKARKMLQDGLVTPYPEIKAKHELKTTATFLYNHQKATPLFHDNVVNGRNKVAYLLCAVYEPSETSSPEKRPKLRTSIQKPLGCWDRIYYAIIAEIRFMYSELQRCYGNDFADGATILHNLGGNGASRETRQPFSAIGMAMMLENMWATLTDDRLVCALDKAVRTKQAEYALSKKNPKQLDYQTAANNLDAEEFASAIEAAEGLVNVNTMTPDEIMTLAWAKHAEEVKRHPDIDLEEQTLLASCRAEIREAGRSATPGSHKSSRSPSSKRSSTRHSRKGSSASHSDNRHTSRDHSRKPSTMEFYCICVIDCHCMPLCQSDPRYCQCAIGRSEVSTLINRQQKLDLKVHKAYDTEDDPLPNNFLGAMSNEVAQMQIAALADPDPFIVRACQATSEAADRLDKQLLEMHRARANTANSEFAYVPPPRTPSRAGKDAYPLGFYGERSGQRYPTLRTHEYTTPPPVYGASFYSNQVPSRKPVPSPLPITPLHTGPADPQSDPSLEQYCKQGQGQIMTPPATSPLEAQSFEQSAQVTYPDIPTSHRESGVMYPAIPTSQSQGLFTQSFPPSTLGNPRSGFVRTDTSITAATYADLADEAHNTIRPFSDEPTAAIPMRAGLYTSTTAPTNNVDLSKPYPPLPEPDFIAPRPALKQRYVSAGGNTPLNERAEIAGPSFPTNISSGAAMHKDELFSKLSDPEFIRATFGEAAVKLSIDKERSSEESKRASGGQQDSQRNSGLEELIRHEKRERTQSGGSTSSGRFGQKLKRVFSRKGSECE